MALLRGLRDPYERNFLAAPRPRFNRSASSKVSLPLSLASSKSGKPQYHLKNLLREIDADDPEKDLVQLQQRICDSIDEFPVPDVLKVFHSAETLLREDDLTKTDLGLGIIAKLAFKPECTPANRLHFFYTMYHDGTTNRYTNFPSYLLTILTDNGRQLEGFEPLLTGLIPALLHEVDSEFALKDVKRSEARASGLPISTSLDLVNNLVKYNARFFRDSDIAALIQGMFELRYKLAFEDPERICDILGTLIIYTHIPKEAVTNATRALCFLRGRESLEEKTSRTFSYFMNTHLKDETIESLLRRFEDEETCPKEAAGAAALLELSLINATTRYSIDLDINRLMDALARPVPEDIASAYARLRLELVKVLVDDAEMQQKLLAAPDWIHIQEAIIQNAKAPLESLSVGLSKEDGSLDRFMKDRENRRETVRGIISCLEHLEGISLQHSRTLRRIALYVAPWLTEQQSMKLISAYQPSSFRISIGNWLGEIRELANHFIFNTACHLTLRQKALKVIKSAWRTAQQLGEDEATNTCRDLILNALDNETNYAFRGNLVHVLLCFTVGVSDSIFYRTLEVLVRSARTGCFHELIEIPFFAEPDASVDPKLETGSQHRAQDEDLPSILPDAGLVVLLMRSSVDQLERSRRVYTEMLQLLAIPERPAEATVMLLRGLFRIRSDLDHRIFFLANSEGESLAKVLHRNADSPFLQSRRSSLQSGISIMPPVWKYGDIHGLPESPPTTVSAVLRSESKPVDGVDCSLDMRSWLETIILMLDSANCDWEVYSYIIVHVGPQVSNQSLFAENIYEIRLLRNLVCAKIQSQTIYRPPETSNLRQGDVALCLYHILTTCIGYHWRFPRKENVDTVTTLVKGLTLWDRTTIACVNALTLSCYELPISLSRDLVRIVAQMSTIVTKSDSAIHVLEFLAGLSRIDELVNQFHGDEIKTVFGVCFSYIDYARGKKFDEQNRAKPTGPPTRNSSIVDSNYRPSTEDIPQYVFALSYHVITFWFLALSKEDQKRHFPWMEQRLLSPDQSGQVQDEAIVTVDHIWRVTEDKDVVKPLPLALGATSESSADPITQTWVSEYCILTIKCHLDNGLVEITERRSSGTDESHFVYPGTDPLSPDLIYQERFASTINGNFKSDLEVVVLPITDATRRALGIFDRISPIDFFKAGVIYIGENQTHEYEILANVSGSPDYNLFIAGLGERVPLKNNRENMAGLDTSEGMFDGRSTLRHSDTITTLNYHVTTMMPTNREMDPQCTRKKSHIGNDYVNIIFNNSGLEFDFNTFPSQFNYVYIVVVPEARQTFIQTRTRSHNPGWYEDSWFKVRVLTRHDFPDISSAAETVVVSGAALSSYVRNLALNAEEFCRVWGNRGMGELPSTWRSRWQQIKMLRERNVPKKEDKVG
ncbi:hypothetical protein E4T47_07847 [Aureobasidium subglaciale]|nr:hypothetical protein E4T47_07847 [Aureobasidium subglaciale]